MLGTQREPNVTNATASPRANANSAREYLFQPAARPRQRLIGIAGGYAVALKQVAGVYIFKTIEFIVLDNIYDALRLPCDRFNPAFSAQNGVTMSLALIY